MKFIPVSDLHLDINNIRRDTWIDFDKDATLIIAGDVSNALHGVSYIKRILCTHFKNVVLISGNHEWYSNKCKESVTNIPYASAIKHSPIPRLKKHADETPNLYFLDNEMVEIDGTTIYGGTLWFPLRSLNKEEQYNYELLMNDMNFLNNRLVDEMHHAFIDNMPEKVDIVVSHHLPNKASFARESDAKSRYAPFYHANLSDDIVNRAKVWIAGHQHEPIEKMIGNDVLFICNPKGSGPLEPGKMNSKSYNVN
ncbi:TPA: metallophosphoesterase [Vibrio parahaemolyticus]|nr:metallophosphoesterase [Vibrio parahaemolyticus]